ncbi:MAG TPA: molybdate ABC transporter substrate-binding protein [Armatimonadota bacterium]|nr:molybdate ABC transporter substrate-binding protein [Armatimonadota bacterium]
MSRGAQILVVALLLAVVVMGGVLLARARQAPEAAAPTAGLVVYAPCGMSSPIAVATQRFREANPGAQVQVVFDNAIVLVRKIRKGDRPDVFISPGELEMKQLVEEGFIEAATVADFGTLDLVVIAPTKTEGLDSVEGLKAPGIKTISLADPKYNSIGYYGEEALKSLGLWEALQSKLLLREYPLEAVTLATNGQVDAGITYLTCPLDTAPEKADGSDVRIVATLPRDSYPPVRLQVAMLKETEKRDVGRQYIDFLISEQGQEAIAANGILPVEVIE